LVSLSHALNHSFWVLIPALTPLILKELNLTYTGAGIIFSVYLATYAAGQIPLGILSQRISRPLIMGVGLLISSLGMALTSIAPDYYSILAFQALAGFGGSAHHPLALYLISDIFPKHRLGRALSIHGISSSLSFTVTPMAAAVMLNLGWSLPLLVFSALAARAGILIILFIRIKPSKVKEKAAFTKLLRNPAFGKLLAIYGLFSLGERGAINFLPLMLIAFYQVATREAGWWFSLFSCWGLQANL
jgi:MFS family permease